MSVVVVVVIVMFVSAHVLVTEVTGIERVRYSAFRGPLLEDCIATDTVYIHQMSDELRGVKTRLISPVSAQDGLLVIVSYSAESGHDAVCSRSEKVRNSAKRV